jgi:hypothetical protein
METYFKALIVCCPGETELNHDKSLMEFIDILVHPSHKTIDGNTYTLLVLFVSMFWLYGNIIRWIVNAQIARLTSLFTAD